MRDPSGCVIRISEEEDYVWEAVFPCKAASGKKGAEA